MFNNKTLTILTLYHGLRSAMFVIPIMYLYYDLQKGVSVQGIYLTESAFSLGIILFTIPAGYLSDLWKRVHVLSLGALFVTLGFTIELFGYGLWQMAFAEFLVGIGFAFSGGSMISAIAYDALLDEGDPEKHLTLQSNLQMIHVVCNLVAMILGGYMYAYEPDLPIALMVVFCAIGGLLTLFLDEPNRHKKPRNKSVLKEMFDVAKYVLHGHKEIACIVLLAVVVLTTTKLGLWMYQPYFKSVGVPDQHFGLVMAGWTLAGVVGAYLAKREGKIKPLYSVLFVLIMPVACYIFAGKIDNIWGISAIILSGMIYNYLSPVIKHAINNRVGSERRGTVLSIQEFVYNIAFVATAWKVGSIGETASPAVALETIGIVCGVFGVVVFYCLRKHKVV